MNDVYLICNISRQAHHKAILRYIGQKEKEYIYTRLMEQTRELHPGMGLRTMYEMLAPEGIGRDAFIALGLQSGFRLTAVEKQTRTTYSIKSNRYINLLNGKRFTSVNQVWSSDITYLHALGKFYYIVMIMDVYSRRIVGFSIADNMRAENNLSALKMAFTLRGINHYNHKLIHHSDKGAQYASDIYTETLHNYGVLISMCDDVYENTHIERINNTIKNQYLYKMHFKDETDLKTKVAHVMKIYNDFRPHKSLKKMTPAAYEEYLKTIPENQREKMEIYTATKNLEAMDPNQLKMMFT